MPQSLGIARLGAEGRAYVAIRRGWLSGDGDALRRAEFGRDTVGSPLAWQDAHLRIERVG